MLNRQSGQSLIEMVIVVAVGVMVASALVFATIASLRNSQFAKNQSVATKLAQEGIEAVRGIRDRNGESVYIYGERPSERTSFFAELYGFNISQDCTGVGSEHSCFAHFSLGSNNLSLHDTGGVSTWIPFDNNPNFSRQIQISDSRVDDKYKKEKLIIVSVKWTDFSGEHESKLSTILSKK